MASTPKILIADRDDRGLSTISEQLDLPFNCTIEHVFSDKELNLALQSKSVSILVIDIDFSEQTKGLTLIHSVQTTHPNLVILPIVPTGKPQLIKKISELDLFYFIHKPVDPVETTVALKRAVENVRGPHTQVTEKDEPPPPSFHGMIGTSPEMQRLFDLIIKVAEDDLSTVLIRGESGTGKEMIAKAIHAQSSRKNNNFVPVNCAAIPDELLESELFGYTKGAFTGATANKPGRIQYADRGTLFLDEIGDMKSSLQAKLLRVLQEKEFEPVGAFKAIPVDTRILAATHCDLEQLVSEGTFREDLYYRLSVIPVNIPPLKERISDIPLLIRAFLKKYAENRGREKFTFSPKALAAIAYYNWRGNVRELENLIQHMSILFSGQEIHFEDLPEKFHQVEIPDQPVLFEETELISSGGNQVQDTTSGDARWESGPIDFNSLINDFETKLILQAMKLTSGNKKEAARLLNLKRTTLLEKIKKKNIEGMWEE